MEVDLHTHSIYSDGELSPSELLDKAKKLGLKVYAITDHDNIEGSKILMNLEHSGITLYSGVEMTAKVSKGQMHILGYNIDLDNKELNDKLKLLKEESRENIRRYLRVLKSDFNIELPASEVEEMLNKVGDVGRPMLAKLLIKNGYCSKVGEAFDKYLIYAYNKVINERKTPTKEEVISLINNAGGIASLAHPWSLELEESELRTEIAYLKSIGLKGIEVIHSRNDEARRNLYHKLAKEFDLLETGGTDFHGKGVKPDIDLASGVNGNVNININDLSFLKNIKSRYE